MMKVSICKLSLFLMILMLSLLLAACSPVEPAAEPEPITLQLSWQHQPNFAGFYFAAQNGDYAAEGLEVSFLEGGPGVDTVTPVVAGAAQFGALPADTLLLARADGQPVKAIATIYRRSPVVYISLAEAGITRPQDFVGKTIRVTTNLIPSLRAMTARVGVTPDQYTEVVLPSDLEQFASGEVSVWGAFIDGLAVQAQQAGHELNIIYPDDYGVHFYSYSLFTTDDLIANNPDLVGRFLRATLKGWTYAIEHPLEVGQVVAKYKPEADIELDNKRFAVMIPLVNTGEDYIGWMKPEIWAGMESTLREQGVLTQALDVAQVYSMQFLQEIYP
jgi:NitT/TauT family transport system substrate-binding protein